MVKRYLLLAALAVLCGTSCATQHEETALDPDYEDFLNDHTVRGKKEIGIACIRMSNNLTLYETKLPKVKSVKITGFFGESMTDWQLSGIGEDDITACKNFLKSVKTEDVVTYFSKAKQISSWDFRNTLLDESCAVEGELTFSTGKKATFAVYRYGRGYLDSDKSFSGFYYCPDCSAPFEIGLSSDDEEDGDCYGKTNPIYYSKDKK